MATRLLIQTEAAPLTVSFPAIAPMTREEFYRFCEANRDLHIEQTAEGEVVIMPPAFSDTGNRNFNITAYLWVWTEQDGTGLGFDSSSGFTLPNGAMRSPDVAWIKAQRWNALSDAEKSSFAPICPDFVIELRSASDRLNGLQEKMKEYIDNGVLLGWLIDRKHRNVHIYRPNKAVEIIEEPSVMKGDPELPGFSLPMTKVW